jgi:hypothetical protein
MGAADNPKWILQCRDLVQLYYGVRMVAQITESQPILNNSTFTTVIQQDPRRIRYEIIIVNDDAAKQEVDLATGTADDPNFNLVYVIPPGVTMVIERSFLSDLDGVTAGIMGLSSNSNVHLSVRETFLTPLPADES